MVDTERKKHTRAESYSQEKADSKHSDSSNSYRKLQAALEVIDQMVDRWPSTIVARKAIGRFTGYTYATKTLSNADARNCGPKNAFRLNGQVVYPIESLTAWLKERLQVL